MAQRWLPASTPCLWEGQAHVYPAAFQVSLGVCLPRDVSGLGLVRLVMDTALAALGVTAACRHEVAVALDEACGNVVRHATLTDEYEVTVEIADGVCGAGAYSSRGC